MTFKHGKFQDSVVMRSLERVAKEKGLVKADDFVKTASTDQLDLTPSTNLLENLLKLASGLREAGFDSYADELESNTFKYKRAQTLYETSKETGKDLIDSAHPKGSHKVEDVDGDAVFRTILDKQLEMTKVVEKNPTGKLASSNDVLKAVKNVLAQEASVPFSQNSISTIFSYTATLSEMFKSVHTFSWESETVLALNRMNAFINATAARKVITMGAVDRIISLANDFKNALDKETFLWMKSAAAKEATFQVSSLINFMQDTVKEEVKASLQNDSKSKVSDAVGQKFLQQLNLALGTLKAWTITVNNDPENSQADKNEAMKWINERSTELTSLRDQFMAETNPEEQTQKAPGFLAALAKSRFNKESAQFKKIWIG